MSSVPLQNRPLLSITLKTLLSRSNQNRITEHTNPIPLETFKYQHTSRAVSYSYSRKGPDIPYIREREIILGRSFMESVEWENSSATIRGDYQIINDLFLFLELTNSNITGEVERYTPEFFHGNTTTISFGINFGY